MPRFGNKLKTLSILFLSFFMLLSSMFSFPKVAHAAWYNQNAVEFGIKVFTGGDNDIFLERYTYAQVVQIANSLILLPVGNKDTFNALQNAIKGTGQVPQTQLDKGVSILINGMFGNLPASATYGLEQNLASIHLVPIAHAQTTSNAGFGFDALAVYRNLWKSVRNFTYAIMSLFVVALAFGIMFRVKLNPQVSISIQSAIPRIIKALILITFSYAIVGLMIDLMYVIFFFLAYGLEAFGGLPASAHASVIVGNFNTADAWSMVTQILSTGAQGLGNLVSANAGVSIGATGVVGALLVAVFSLLGSSVALAAVVPVFLGLIIAVITYLVRIIIMLAKAYVILLIYLVFGPIFILFDILPGAGGSTSTWFKTILTQILIFFVVGVLFMLNTILIGAIVEFTANKGLIWSAPYIGANAAFLQALISLAIVSLVAEADKFVASFVQTKLPVVGGGLREFEQAPQQLITNLTKPLQERFKPAGTGAGTAAGTTGPGGGPPAPSTTP